ncbi:NAD(P)H-dependent oxidoreductase [Salinispira pacifica]
MELVSRLREREAAGHPIRVGVIGCGQMGSGLAHTVNNITGMRIAAIADIAVDRAVETFVQMGWAKSDIRIVRTAGEAEDALRQGCPMVTEDAMLMTATPSIDANVEATGVTDIGAMAAYQSILNRKPIIMLNAETDVTVGYYLNYLARRTGSLYTVASGDEPGVLKMLYEQAVMMGFEVVCLGKGKNNPINTSVTPDDCIEEAKSKDMNPKMLSSFIDGTKTMVEMAAVANATGLEPDVPGMHGPRTEIEDLASTFIPKSDGGIFSAAGRVDYSTGRVAPGVFAIVRSEDPRIRKDMKFITHAEGPYYLQYRPYHLCDIETPQSIAEAVLLGEVTVTAESMQAEVVCTAKRDLEPGQKVESIGGRDWHGKIYPYRTAREQRMIPIGIGTGGTVTHPVRKGEVLTEANFAPDRSSFVYRLRAMQDALEQTEGPLDRSDRAEGGRREAGVRGNGRREMTTPQGAR